MALVKYGGGIIQMSGSIAGNTYARNRYANYVRARTKPVNPRTTPQILVRTILSSLTNRWYNTLDDAQRTAWATYAAAVKMKNRLGEVTELTGFNHYIRSNSLKLLATYAPADAAPTVLELAEKDPTFAIAAGVAANKITLTLDDTLPWRDDPNAMSVWFQGRPQNKTRNFFAGPWRYLGCVPCTDEAPIELTPIFTLVAGQRQWVYGRIVRADGRVSEPMQDDCIIVA